MAAQERAGSGRSTGGMNDAELTAPDILCYRRSRQTVPGVPDRKSQAAGNELAHLSLKEEKESLVLTRGAAQHPMKCPIGERL